MENREHQASQWQKIIRPPKDKWEDEVQSEGNPPGWIRKYLDLADLLIRRAQRRVERSRLRSGGNYRDAA
jgi:hypothetical protein